MRSVSVEDGSFLVNRRPVPLRLVLDQGYLPHTGGTRRTSPRCGATRSSPARWGFTGARKHQKTEDSRCLALADRMGLRCAPRCPRAHRPGPRATARLPREWPDVVTAHRGHPSVVAWVPLDEGWGMQEAEVDPSQRALVAAMASIANALDATSPVSADDGWETLGVGILGIHDYTQDSRGACQALRDAGRRLAHPRGPARRRAQDRPRPGGGEWPGRGRAGVRWGRAARRRSGCLGVCRGAVDGGSAGAPPRIVGSRARELGAGRRLLDPADRQLPGGQRAAHHGPGAEGRPRRAAPGDRGSPGDWPA